MPEITINQALQAGLQHHQAGRLSDAAAAYQQILAHQPDHADALCLLGVVAGQTGQHNVALDLINRSIAGNPDNADAHYHLGNTFRNLSRPLEAIAAYQKSVLIRPDFAEAWCKLGVTQVDSSRLAPAIESFQRAIAIRPGLAALRITLGNALLEKGDLRDSIAAFEQAIALEPGNCAAYNNLGIALFECGQLEESAAAHRRAIAIKPDYADGHHSLSMLSLLLGDFTRGWEKFEWRETGSKRAATGGEDATRLWDGGDLTGRTIFIHPEQGLGDTLQFIRYIPLLAARGPKIMVGCPAPLRRLLRCINGVDRWLDQGEPIPPFDFRCPLMSLPLKFGTTLETVPDLGPYVKPDHADVLRWQNKLAADGGGFKVGLVWAGNPRHRRDRIRSMDLRTMAPLAQVPGVRFYSLQKGPAADQAKAPVPGMNLIDHTDELNDFADTAAMIANLDLVISVDTSMVHLAGAMAKTVWTLLPFAPDWRWLLGRDDSPWYPTMRLFRQQTRGNWDAVIGQVTDALVGITE